MLKLADLATRPDFDAGPLHVSPSRRLVEGPAGHIHLEPIVMKVFLLLLDSVGEVVTRDQLLGSAWGNAFVGDDSLNRAIGCVRKIASEAAPGVFEIETVPRTGYRMTGRIIDEFHRLPDPRVAGLVSESRQLMRAAMPGGNAAAIDKLRDAAQLEPSNASAWGLLALACRNAMEEADPAEVSGHVLDCDSAARQALAIDPAEPSARLALAILSPEFGSWGATEDALRAIAADSPAHLPTLSYLLMVLQAVGRASESWELNEHVLALDPLAPVPLFRRGLKLWVFGRLPEADLAIDRALQLWPDHPAVWNARLMIFAFTGRAGAARDLLEDERSRPALLNAGAVDYWRSSLGALDGGSDADIESAVRTNFALAPTSPYFASNAMMVLAMLGRVDEAYAVAEGALLRRGPLVGSISAGKTAAAVHDQHWRRTMSLFTPPMASLRADPRFGTLCEEIGMTAYWRSRGVGPDAMFGFTPFGESPVMSLKTRLPAAK